MSDGSSSLEITVVPGSMAWVPQRAAGDDATPMPMPVPIYFINRDHDVERASAMRRQLQALGLSARRVVGVDGLAVPAVLHNQFFDGDKLASRMKPGEVGCYASHLIAMQAMLDSGQPYALILEDDAILTAETMPTLERAVANAPSGWGMINVCRTPGHATRTVIDLGDGRRIVRCSRLPAGMVGYLVSRVGALKITQERKRRFPSDVELRAPWLFDIDAYCLMPQLIEHNWNTASIIGQLGGQSRLRRGLPRPSLYCWTGNPLHSLASIRYNIGKLGFRDWVMCSIANGRRLVLRRTADIARHLRGGRKTKRPVAGQPSVAADRQGLVLPRP